MKGAFFVVLLSLGCSIDIEHGLDERSANEAVLALQRSGVSARKDLAPGQTGNEGRQFSIRVPSGQATQAMEVLKANELPRGKGAAFRDLYGKPSLVPSPGEERARFLDALSGELGRTLETVDGVITARVHLALPEVDSIVALGDRQKPTAAVLLKIRKGSTGIAETDVKRLVAGAVPGLTAEVVSVVVVEATSHATTPQLAYVGPIAVEASSRGALTTLIVTSLGTILLLGGCLLATALRHARLRKHLTDLERRI